MNVTDAYSTGKIKTISDDGTYVSAVYTSGDWKEPLQTNLNDNPGKKKFERLIKKASQPAPKARGKSARGGNSSEK